MLDCLILGDSIAVGIAKYRPECVVAAKVGITSSQFIKKYDNFPDTPLTIISLGSNDGVNAVYTRESLEELRATIKTDYVIWILPNYNKFHREVNIIESIAQKYGDGTIDIPSIWLDKDQVHPTETGYNAIANETRNLPD